MAKALEAEKKKKPKLVAAAAGVDAPVTEGAIQALRKVIVKGLLGTMVYKQQVGTFFRFR